MTKVFDDRRTHAIHAFAPGTTLVSFSRAPGALALLTGLEYRFSRQASASGTLNGPYILRTAKHPSGQVMLNTAVTTSGNLEQIIKAYETLCGGGYVTVQSYDPCSGAVGQLVFGDCTLDGVVGGVESEHGIVTCGLAFLFTQMWVHNV